MLQTQEPHAALGFLPIQRRLQAPSLPWGPGPGPGGWRVRGHSGHSGAQGLPLGHVQGSAGFRELSALATSCSRLGQQVAPAGRLGGRGCGVPNHGNGSPRPPSVQVTSPVSSGDFAVGRWLASEAPVANQRLDSACGTFTKHRRDFRGVALFASLVPFSEN